MSDTTYNLKESEGKPMDVDIIGGFPFADPNCKGCGKPLELENACITDGCPCNTPLGVNSMNETRWRLLMRLQQEQTQKIERLYKPAASKFGHLFCWCVENLQPFPPMDGEWIEDVKTKLSALAAAQKRIEELERESDSQRLIVQVEQNAYYERVYRGESGVAPDWIYEARRNREVAENNVPWLDELLKALDWQGGTIHQAISAIKRMVAVAKENENCPSLKCPFEKRAESAESRLSALATENERLRSALAGLVKCNEDWNEAVLQVIQKPLGWTDGYLDEARAVLNTPTADGGAR